MAWIVLEGVDRSGKSTVAEFYKKQGYEVIHMSAPDKKYSVPGYTGPSYIDDLVELLVSKTGHNIIWDRPWYGELVWPTVYGRSARLEIDDLEMLKELEQQNNTDRLLMIDENPAAHWKRCVDNKEPLTRPQFDLANRLYSQVAHKHEFAVMTLPKFLEINNVNSVPNSPNVPDPAPTVAANGPAPSTKSESPARASKATPEQARLERANAINAILRSKRIFKQSGDGAAFDELEVMVRDFLNSKLGELLGSGSDGLTKEDVMIVKEFVKRLKEKRT